MKPIQVLPRLAALERRSGVVRAHGSGYRFDHHQIQELLSPITAFPARELPHPDRGRLRGARKADGGTEGTRRARPHTSWRTIACAAPVRWARSGT